MKNVLGMCLNWKVLAGVGVVAIGLWAIAPQLVLAALPLLLLAVCPLSMALMAWTMRGTRAELPAPQGRTSERSQS